MTRKSEMRLEKTFFYETKLTYTTIFKALFLTVKEKL